MVSCSRHKNRKDKVKKKRPLLGGKNLLFVVDIKEVKSLPVPIVEIKQPEEPKKIEPPKETEILPYRNEGLTRMLFNSRPRIILYENGWRNVSKNDDVGRW